MIKRIDFLALMMWVKNQYCMYAMCNKKDGTKGVFVNGYGLHVDEETTAIINQILFIEIDNKDWMK